MNAVPKGPMAFGLDPTAVPGTEPVGGRYAFPAFGTRVTSDLKRQRPPQRDDYVPNLADPNSTMRMMEGSAPAAKRARTVQGAAMGSGIAENRRRHGPITGPMAGGRLMNPSYLVNAVAAASAAPAAYKPGYRSSDFMTVNRQVFSNKEDWEFAETLDGQVVWNHVTKFQEVPDLPYQIDINGMDIINDPLGSGGMTHPDGIYALYNTPAANWVLRTMDTYDRRLRADDVADMLRLDGIVRSSDDESNQPVYRDSNVRNYAITYAQRQQNAVNIFGAVHPDQRLWFVIKRLDPRAAPKEYVLSPKCRMNPRSLEGDYFPNPIQIIPWTSPFKERPDADDLRYEEIIGDESTVRTGVAIYLGFAQQKSTPANEESIEQAWYNSTMIRSLPKLDVHIVRTSRHNVGLW